MQEMVCAMALAMLPATMSDPLGDVYLPGAPDQPALASGPDLVAAEAMFDTAGRQIHFALRFHEPVYPADDFGHVQQQVHGFIDIDLDVPPVNLGTSQKSQFSGFASQLGIEAYIDLATATAGEVSIFGVTGSPESAVPIVFDGTSVEIAVPFSVLYPDGEPGTALAYAVYVFDAFQGTSDVFPNGDSFAVVPEPRPAIFLAAAIIMWLGLAGAPSLQAWVAHRFSGGRRESVRRIRVPHR